MKGHPLHPVKRGVHGTSFDFEGEVLPKQVHGNEVFRMSAADDTYFTPLHHKADPAVQERVAWGWATSSMREHGGRPRVHVTEPIGKQHVDRNMQGNIKPPGTPGEYVWDDPERQRRRWDETRIEGARVAPAQKIVDTKWMPAPDKFKGEFAVQGTLPHVNWRQFNGPNWMAHGQGDAGGGQSYQFSTDEKGYMVHSTSPGWAGPDPALLRRPSQSGMQMRGQQQFNLDPLSPKIMDLLSKVKEYGG